MEEVSCLHKLHGSRPEPVEAIIEPSLMEGEDELEKEKTCQSSLSDKKTDEQTEQPKQQGYIWRLSSGLVNTTTGALSGAFGLGVGSVKWVAVKGYSAGSAVVGTTKTVVSKVPVPTWKKKDKKE